MKKYDKAEIASILQSLPNWKFENNFLIKTFIFKDFSEAFGFIARVALLSETIGHHPDWSGVYNKVTIKLNTHEVGGITDNDFAFAEKIEQFFE